MKLFDDDLLASDDNNLALAKLRRKPNENPVTYLQTKNLRRVVEMAETMEWERLAVWAVHKRDSTVGPVAFAPEDAEVGVAVVPVIWE